MTCYRKRAGRVALAALVPLVGACAPIVPILGGSAVLGTTVIEERSTLAALNDTDIALGVAHRLGNHSGELYRDVHVDVTEGAVVLTGSVPRAEDKIAAAEAAWATPGVASVADEITVAADAGTNSYLRDVAISNTVRYRFGIDPQVRRLNFTVTTIDRTVYLTGIARSRDELARAIDIASRTEGVAKVVNHALTIDDPRRVARIAKSG